MSRQRGYVEFDTGTFRGVHAYSPPPSWPGSQAFTTATCTTFSARRGDAVTVVTRGMCDASVRDVLNRIEGRLEDIDKRLGAVEGNVSKE